MPYPDEGTAEFWDLVAQGYRLLAEHPPKFMAPGSTIEGYRMKAIDAETKAENIRNPVVLVKPTEEFEKSLRKREVEIEENQEPKRTVTEDLWKTVLMLN